MYPYFRLYGMTYDEYWNGPAELTSAAAEAYRLKTEARNHELWWQGKYFCDALMAVTPFKKGRYEYPSEPYRITPLTEEEQEESKEKALEKAISFFNVKADAWSRNNAERND